jgi:hypothetical protein
MLLELLGPRVAVRRLSIASSEPTNFHIPRCTNYFLWKRNFQAVYKKYIEAHLERSSQSPVKIAVLDTGIDQTHPDMDARIEQIKGKYNCINEKFESVVNDYNGHGTFIAGLLLDYAPDAELYIIKIAENKPSNPEIIAKVTFPNNLHFEAYRISD